MKMHAVRTISYVIFSIPTLIDLPNAPTKDEKKLLWETTKISMRTGSCFMGIPFHSLPIENALGQSVQLFSDKSRSLKPIAVLLTFPAGA